MQTLTEIWAWISAADGWWKVGVAFIGGVLTSGLGLWRIFSGYYFVNLSIALELARTPKQGDASTHDLVATIKLEKGKAGTLELQSMRVSIDLENVNPVDFGEQLRVCGRQLKLPPEEKTQFAAHFDVPSERVCTITIDVTGKSIRPLRRPTGHWRASAISVPGQAKRD